MSTIIQKTEIEDRFQISPNSKFDILPHRGVTLLENTPKSVQYAKISETLNGAQTITLNYQIGERVFLDRGVFVEVDVPVKLTPTAAFGAPPDYDNYLTLAQKFKDIAFRQYGILSCVDQLNVQFNNQPVTSLTNVQRCFESTSEYYNGALIDRFFPASQPDRFVDYAHYASTGATDIQALNEDGEKVRLTIPAISEENFFDGAFSNKYNSRKPMFKIVGGGLGEMRCLIKTFMYIPFSFFSTPDAETSLYGINQLTVQVTMMDNWLKRLFVTRGTFWQSIDFDSLNQSKHTATLHMKTYVSPDYVQNAMMDKNGMPKPYRIAYNRIFPQPPKRLTKVAPLSVGHVAISDQLNFGSLPKHIYLSIHPLTTTGALHAPNFKGRINQIEVTIGGVTTLINKSVLTIYDLCKGNGLVKDYEASMFTNGFVCKLDVSKDLGCAGHLIGANIPTTIQFTIHYDNLEGGATDRDYELRIAASFPSQLVYDNREFKLFTSLILSNAPYDITNQAAAMYGELSPKIMTIGAGVFGDIWNGIKKGANAGIKWVKNNPDKVAEYLGKGIRALAGGNVPYQQNMIGGQETLLLGAGAGSVNRSPFK